MSFCLILFHVGGQPFDGFFVTAADYRLHFGELHLGPTRFSPAEVPLPALCAHDLTTAGHFETLGRGFMRF